MILLILVIAQMLDLVTLVAANAVWGFGGEANPVAVAAYDAAGMAGVAALKVGGLGLVLLTYSRVSESFFRDAVLVFLIMLGFLGAAVNLYAVWVAL